MREIRAYGSVGVSAGNRRHYPAITKGNAQGAKGEAQRASKAQWKELKNGNSTTNPALRDRWTRIDTNPNFAATRLGIF
jgi:hypothetical protein